jgi:uncharacterized protein (TIGR03905 family)
MDTNLMKIVYSPEGTCSSRITIVVEGKIIREALFEGGCDGNLTGICRLIIGMNVNDVIQRLQGIDCDERGTSCPDQLARALQKSL